MAESDSWRGHSGEMALSTVPTIIDLLDQAPAIIFVKDLAGRFLYANHALETTFGIPRSELLGRTVFDFWGDEAPDFTEHDQQVINARRPFLFDEFVTQADGPHVYLSFKFPLLTDDGEVQGLGGISTDVTDRSLAVQELEAAKERAERSSEAKLDFIARMNHELRTPLNAISGFAQLLLLDDLSESQREAAEIIVRASNHLACLIDEILDISRLESGRVSRSVEPVALSDVATHSLDMVRRTAGKRGIQINVQGSGLWAHFVRADRQRLLQVLLNLLTNALKYNRPGGTVTFACRPGDTPSKIAIDVSVTGPGIAPDKLDLFFTPSERLGAEDSEVEGTDVGLSLAKALIEQMDGSLRVASRIGEGTTFTVELDRLPSPRAAATIGATEAPSSPALQILYFEDNLANFEVVDRLLRQRSNTTLIPAIHGALGIELAREHQPDLVLVEFHLPDMTGADVLRQLRADRTTRDLPVVVLTADDSPGLSHQLIEAGARDVLKKPIDLGVLMAIIDSVAHR
ncbi:MAG: PAS domain-containing protein [Acidimicrobiales bacterium]|nr:PAS domain-containing protein [Acidimicrobiales bacterium]